MKRFFILVALAAVAFCACVQELDNPELLDELTPEQTAVDWTLPHSVHVDVSEPDTKALITPKTGGGYTFEWTGNESIRLVEALYDVDGNLIYYTFGLQFYPYEEGSEEGYTEEPCIFIDSQGKASFDVEFFYDDEIPVSQVATVKYFGAIFDKDSGNRPYLDCNYDETAGRDIYSLSLSFASEQIARANSFDPANDPLVSETLTYSATSELPSSFSMAFARLGSIIKMTLTGLAPGTKVYDVVFNTEAQYEDGLESFPVGSLSYDPLSRTYDLPQWGDCNISLSFYRDPSESNDNDDDYGYEEPPYCVADAYGKLDLWVRTLPFTLDSFDIFVGNEESPCKDPNGHYFRAHKSIHGANLEIPNGKIVTMNVNLGDSNTEITYLPEIDIIAPEGIECGDGSYIGYVGNSYKFDVSVLYPEGWDGTLAWSTSDSSYISVSQDGTITILRMPEYSPYVRVYITDAVSGAYIGYISFEIRRLVATSLSITTPQKTMGRGTTWTVDLVVEPAGAVVSWSVDPYWIASVSNGVVTANSAGTATVTATSGNLQATCEITVVDQAILPSGQAFNAYAARIMGSLSLIKNITFENSSSDTGTCINEGLSPVPIYMWKSGSVIHVSTPASKFITDEDCSQMFKGMSEMLAINNLGYVDTSEARNMSEMFSGCSGFGRNTVHDPSYYFTSLKTSNVTDMSNMFEGCYNLLALRLDDSRFDTANVTDMSGMFKGCSGLETIYFGDNFKTDKVTTMKDMFYECKKLKPGTSAMAKLRDWNVSNVEDMHQMFYYCGYSCGYNDTGENNYYLGNWNTAKVKDMGGMFSYCNNADSIDMTGWNTSSVIDMSNMFDRCLHARYFIMGDSWVTSSVTSMKEMFAFCNYYDDPIVFDLHRFDTSHVTDMYQMFSNNQYLTSLDLSSFDLSGVQDLRKMFDYCSRISTITIGGANPWGTDASASNIFGSSTIAMIGYYNSASTHYTSFTCSDSVWSAISTALGSRVSNYAHISTDSAID